MPRRPKSPWKRLAIDLAGFGLLASALLFSWVPGPGGIPLLIAALSVLAINHEWARRWRNRARDGGLSLTNKVFINHPIAKWALDIIGGGLIALAVIILNTYTGSLYTSLAIAAGFMGVGLFLGNRQRLQRLIRLLRRK